MKLPAQYREDVCRNFYEFEKDVTNNLRLEAPPE